MLSIELKNLTKIFANCIANQDVNLLVRKGTIHGIVGENGAGKSTAMKMLYGQYSPDGGEVWVEGEKRKWRSPADAIRAGIGMVHQHFMLAGPYTVLDNILLGAEGASHFGFIPRSKALAKLTQIQEQYGFKVNLNANVEDLSVGEQQRVEILKLLFRDAKILILDEPTAVLTPQETAELFQNLKRLKAEGKTILIITHKLKEVMNVTDEVTVFRGGKVTGSTQTTNTSVEQLAEWMVGRKVVLRVEVPEQKAFDKIALKCSNLTSSGHLKNVSLEVKAGEIVGIAGVEGNGQTELIHALVYPTEKKYRVSGKVELLGEDISNCATRDIRSRSFGIIAEDRHHEAVLLEKTLFENLVLGYQRDSKNSKKGVISWDRVQTAATALVEEYDVKPRAIDAELSQLSGGNQQKWVIAREMRNSPEVLVAAQPTRGVDVGAIEFIHKRIIAARDRGAGVLLVSSELDEIMALSDRILVFYEGEIVAEYLRGQTNERELGLKMGGVQT